jgi:hypothetical protein
MTAREVISFIDRSGGKVWLEGSKLKYQLPQDRPELLETLKANRDVLMGFLEGQITLRSNQTLEPLPQDLHALVRAASSGVLPKDSMKLETGLTTDFERFVLGYAAQILTGDRQHALGSLYVALRAYDNHIRKNALR